MSLDNDNNNYGFCGSDRIDVRDDTRELLRSLSCVCVSSPMDVTATELEGCDVF